MKRIPEENMLDYAIEHHCVIEAAVRNAAVLLARYYQTAEPALITGEHYSRQLEDDISENYIHLSSSLYALSPDLLKNLHDGLLWFLHANHSLFWEGAFSNKIIDAHGDLLPEHVCLKPEPAIIDRLESSKRLRTMDTAEELSYLSMECELLGNRQVVEWFFTEYTACTDDYLHDDLLTFFKAKKAFIRTYLVVRHMDEER